MASTPLFSGTCGSWLTSPVPLGLFSFALLIHRASAIGIARSCRIKLNEAMTVRLVCGEGYTPAEAVRRACGDGYKDATLARFREALDGLKSAYNNLV